MILKILKFTVVALALTSTIAWPAAAEKYQSNKKKVESTDPVVPPGVDPGGTAVAIVTTGIDYTDPVIAARLARDGEGQIIAYDFVDDDVTPYGTDPKANALAKLLLKTNPNAKLIPVRILPDSPAQLAWSVKFVSRTPARITAVPYSGTDKFRWTGFVGLIASTPNTMFVISAGTEKQAVSGVEVWPGAGKTANAVVAAPKQPDAPSDDANQKSVPYANVDAWVAHSKTAAIGETTALSSAEAVVILTARAACRLKSVVDTKLGAELRTEFMNTSGATHANDSIASTDDGPCASAR